MKLAVNTVTLRAYSPKEVVSILLDNKIDAVEWAGDAHVPTGDLETAASVKALCEEAGVTCTSYGSYYQCAEGGPGNGPFENDLGPAAALDTAKALGVSAIRVWAGRLGVGSVSATAEYRKEVERCLADFCDQAASIDMTVHLEFHRNSLTDTAKSAVALIEAVGKENLFSYWQPRHGVDVAGNLADIAVLENRISNIHVFHWLLKGGDGFAVDRRPMSEGKDRWEAYFSALEKLPGEHYAMMEFVRDDSLPQLVEDLSVLRSINGCAEPSTGA